MPGRLENGGSGATRSAGIRAKSLKSAGRTSSSSIEIPDEGIDTALRRGICGVFADAQKSTSGHRKAIITLRKIQEACCYEPVVTRKNGQSTDESDEDDFNTEFVRCVIRIVPVKKAEPVGDRVVRFLGTFLNVASGKDNEIAQQDGGNPDATTLIETPTSRLTTHMLTSLLPLLQAKDKTVRFRATQIISHVINSLDTLDDGLFHQLRFALLKRIHDKEAPVRLQAVYGLGRLAVEVTHDSDEADSDSDADSGAGSGVLAKLLDILQHDPSAEVRRNLLLNLPLTKDVLPYLLERARDADGPTRRALYARLLPSLGDFRHLSLTHREKLLRWGLRDRDDTVRKATAKLFRERWIEDCAALPAAQAAEQQQQMQDGGGKGQDPQAQKSSSQSAAAAPSLDALLELLERVDVVSSGGEGGIALVAMRDFWQGRPDYVDYVSFPNTFWDDLSPELALVARTFNEYCRSPADEHGYAGQRPLDAIADERLPEVTRFGFLLERELNRLIDTVVLAAGDEAPEDAEEELAQREFVVEQMLHMALTFDYSDEVGRRKMSRLMREALALPDLPEEVTRLVVEVLRLVCGEDTQGEREFCGVVLEAIAEVHDTIMGETEDSAPDDTSVDESFHSATSTFVDDDNGNLMPRPKTKKGENKEEDPEKERETAVREIMVNMKCLHIALCMLQNVQCDLEENAHLVTMLNNLVVPAVRSQEAPIRERGLLCLGLCCLLGENLAKENLTLFLHCFTKGHAALQTIALQIITDMLIAHRSLLTTPTDNRPDSHPESAANEALKPILKAFSKSLKSDDAAVQATGATALSKVMLSRIITDPDLLKQLVVTYFDPDTLANSQLRQSLSYFLPVYCHSRAENAARMATVACAVISKLTTLREAFLEDAEVDTGDIAGDGGMVKLNLVGQMILDWTDPRRIVGFAEAANAAEIARGAGETHLVLAENILERLVTSQVNKEEKKVLFSMLGKLHIPAGGSRVETVKTVLELLTEAIDTRVATDETTRKILTKLQTALLKLMHDAMTDERGGGGPDETAVEATQLAAARPDMDDSELNEDPEDDGDVEQTLRNLKDFTVATTTAGFGFTTALPDAEGTRLNLAADEDTEMTGVDEQEED